MLVFFMDILWTSILRPFDIYNGHLVYFEVYFPHFWYIVPKKSGNPVGQPKWNQLQNIGSNCNSVLGLAPTFLR
jgi:hypothetical protein